MLTILAKLVETSTSYEDVETVKATTAGWSGARDGDGAYILCASDKGQIFGPKILWYTEQVTCGLPILFSPDRSFVVDQVELKRTPPTILPPPSLLLCLEERHPPRQTHVDPSFLQTEEK